MYARQDPDLRLRRLAELQAGVLSAEQVTGHDLGRHSLARLIAQHRWQQLTRGVYWTGGDGDPPWLARAWAGLLVGGPGSMLGGLAALHLHELHQEPDVIDVWVGGLSPSRPRTTWRLRFDDGRQQRRATGEPSRLRVEPALLDVVGELDAAQALDLVLRAVQGRTTSTARLAGVMAGRHRQRHRALLQDLLADVDTGIESPLESHYVRDVERAHGLPTAVRQHRGAGGRRRDNFYAPYGLVVELDGRHHEGAGRHRDMERDNAATLSGERTLRFGWYDIQQRPCVAAAQVARLLMLGGWPGELTRCRRCERVPDLESLISL